MTLWLLLIPLLAISYEDFRYRAIHWWWIPTLMALVILHRGLDWPSSLQNLGLILIQLIVLTVYFSIKEKRWCRITDRYLGLGDILFFIPLALFFSTYQFVLFFVISSLLTILLTLLLGSIFKKIKTIPLAGWQSIYLMVFILLPSNYQYNSASGLQSLLSL